MRLHIFRNVLLLSAIVLSGCATVANFVPGAGQTYLGQLSYKSKTRSFVGDIVLQKNASGEIKLDFMKGPGPAMLSIQQDGERARVKGAAVGIGWQGKPSDASTQLTGWLLIQPTIAALDAGKPLPKGVEANLTKSPDGKWTQLKMSIPARRESFHFVFQS